jgi:UDP-N-acetylglucosamine acyltransferase
VTANFRNLLVGINVIGLRRGGVDAKTRMEIKRAFKLVYRSGLRVREALEEAEKCEWGPETREFFEFIRSSKRGTCTSNRLADIDSAEAEE